ncbi:MAG: hypothetical protein PSX36_11530 [bacterium]|nr:hypothetical protein [bacterium]
MRKISSITVFFFAFAWMPVVVGQTNQTLRTQAYQAEKDKDWFGAAQYYQRLYFRDSSDFKLAYKYADASRLNYDLDVALRLYQKVAAIDNGRKFPLTFYWIAQIQKNKQQYKIAKQLFTKFYKLPVSEKRRKKYGILYYKNKAKLEIDACDMAQIYINNPVQTTPEHLETTINSKLSEYAPLEKDSAFYFSSIRFPEKKGAKGEEPATSSSPVPNYSKIYKADIRFQKLKKVKALDTTFNSNVLHSANSCFSPDGKQMIISKCKAKNASEYQCELYVSTQAKNRWLTPVKMDSPINQPSVSTTQANFGTLNGKTVLFFASDRAGGEGGLDIWYSSKNEDGTYGDAVNAGKNINTVDDDITPWFVNETGTLFFSSTYHAGLGGFDVFKSEFKENAFQLPQNAGYPINSSYNDMYYSANAAGTHVYLSSNRVGSFFDNKMNCCNDIYRFTIDTTKVRPVPIDTAKIVKEQIKLLVPLTLYFHNDEPEPRTTVTITSKSYETTFNEYKALSQQYTTEYAKGLKGDEKNIATNTIENFFSDSVDAGLDNLQRFSDLLEKVMLNGETVKITMKGYCSPLASSNYNINLAKRRISSLRNYFMQTKNGWFVKYIDNQTPGEGKIILEDMDIGELPTSKVSDNFKDKRNSVYSPYAASERKIQILAVSFGN